MSKENKCLTCSVMETSSVEELKELIKNREEELPSNHNYATLSQTIDLITLGRNPEMLPKEHGIRSKVIELVVLDNIEEAKEEIQEHIAIEAENISKIVKECTGEKFEFKVNHDELKKRLIKHFREAYGYEEPE